MAWPPRGDLHSTFSICEATLSPSSVQWGLIRNSRPGPLCCHSVCISVCRACPHIRTRISMVLELYMRSALDIQWGLEMMPALYSCPTQEGLSDSHRKSLPRPCRTEQGAGVYSYTQMELSEGWLYRACPCAPGLPFWLNTNIFFDDSCSSNKFSALLHSVVK